MSESKENRSIEQLKEHYEIEKELADRLRSSTKEERKYLYTNLYDEMFTRVPHHPQLINKLEPSHVANTLKANFKLLQYFLSHDSTFLEIGPGDCALSLEVAKIVKEVYAIDVSEIISSNSSIPDNFHLIISDGCSIPVPKDTIDIAYSNQLMEHLHPEDAIEQLGNIYSVLKPGGKYLCITPNRIFGPHDISQYFDEVATGFHLKEYTISELANIFREVGFSSTKLFINFKGFIVQLPLYPATTTESVLLRLSYTYRKMLAKHFLLRLALGGGNIKLVATK